MNLDKATDEELLEYARTVAGSDRPPDLGTIPLAFRRLAAMIDVLRERLRTARLSDSVKDSG